MWTLDADLAPEEETEVSCQLAYNSTGCSAGSLLIADWPNVAVNLMRQDFPGDPSGPFTIRYTDPQCGN